MKNADISKKIEKYPSGHILENKCSIWYHCKMARLDLYPPVKKTHQNMSPCPIKNSSKSAKFAI